MMLFLSFIGDGNDERCVGGAWGREVGRGSLGPRVSVPHAGPHEVAGLTRPELRPRG